MKQLIINPENPNGILVDMTSEEIAQRETDVLNEETKKTAEDNAKTAKATAQASGNTKLLALGLTQEEATALTGYSIPVVSEEE
jgi:hypothetical protein